MSTNKRISSKEIGEKIKKRRKELKMSQEELAEALDVTYQQIQRYENGTNRLKVEKIQAVAEALSVPLSYFFESYRQKVSESGPPYLTTDETRLLGYFRKIKANASKETVIKVARLAAK